MRGEAWLVDCGANYFMTPHSFQVKNLKKSPLKSITVAGGEELPVEGEGEVTLLLGEQNRQTLRRVQLVPGLTCPLLSVSRLEDMGFKTMLA